MTLIYNVHRFQYNASFSFCFEYDGQNYSFIAALAKDVSR